jgi:hypothetical protein
MCMSLAQDTITGFLLAGVGNIDLRRKSNFLIVDQSELHCAHERTVPFAGVPSLASVRLGLTSFSFARDDDTSH